ncbi:MAG TPA: presqualene diphosphate synthase HpnD [Actinomycetota bacterium]|nr:presqualene diphosphate synthase HpnD [Actinomycetota bacterium]
MKERPEAVRHCERVTRARARNFWYGIRLLPPAKREALAAVYAMARRVDDVGDGDLPADAKLAALDRIEESLAHVDPASPDPVLAALGLATRRFLLPLDAFRELVEGVRMDVRGTHYGSFEELLVYCRRVAGTIGRLSLAVFGASRMAEAEPLADDLGVAMQLTNILRDVREDLGRGRVYLPEEDLARFGCTGETLVEGRSPALRALVRFEARRARAWFSRGLRLLPHLDRRSAACAGAMAGIYLRLLGRVEARPEEVFARRVSLPGWEKAWVAGRALAGVVA